MVLPIFFINLIPVIGILQVGEQGSADRYMYIPMTGLLIFFVYLAYDTILKLKFCKNSYLYFIFGVVFILFVFKTFDQSKVWLNSENLFKNMVEDSFNPAQGYLNIGLEYKKKGNYLKAVEYYKKAIEADPKKAGAYNNLGSALYQLKDIDGAKEAFRKAVELNPNHSVMVYNFALACEVSGNIEEAKKYYLKALFLNPKAPSPRKNLINILIKEKKFDDALKLSMEGEKYVDYDPYFSLKCGFIYQDMGKIEMAKSKFEECYSKFKDNYDVLSSYGNFLYSIKEFEKAKYFLKKALSLNPIDVSLIITISDIELTEGRIEDAISTLKEGLKHNPSDINLKKRLLKIEESRGKEDGKKLF